MTPQSKKWLKLVEANAMMERDGWKEGTHLIHKQTRTEIVLGVWDKDGYWAMTVGSAPKKGKLSQIQIVEGYEAKPAT